jgi:hypothetical protein
MDMKFPCKCGTQIEHRKYVSNVIDQHVEDGQSKEEDRDRGSSIEPRPKYWG